MLIEVNVVNGDGLIIENYIAREEDALHDNWIIVPIPEGLFTPMWDFENKKWIEGLSPDEVKHKRNEINDFNSRVTDEEMNAIAIMELTQMVLGR